MPQKAKCKYWDKCFRKEKTHLSQFLHPGDVSDSDDSDADPPSKKAANGSSSESKLAGKTVVFTGTLLGCTRNTAEARARDHGCRTTKAVSKATDYLIIGEDAGSKEDKAKALGKI